METTQIKTKIKNLIITFFVCYFVGSCVVHNVKAEDITTGNLLPNVGDGVDWNSSSTDQINPGSSGYVSNNANLNGFTVTCATSQSNCGYKWSVGGDFEVTGTATLSVDDIALTNNDRTQDMLDNGITLNNYIDIANCDHEAGNCEGDSGATDSHTITIKVKNSGGTILSTTTQTRTDIDGFKGNCNGYPTNSSAGVSAACGQYNNTVVFNDTGANKLDWSWSGTDNNTGSASRGGPNLLGAKLVMTYDNTVISTEASTALDDIEETLDDLQEEVFEDMEEFIFEEEDFSFNEEASFEEPVFEMETTTMEFSFSEEFFEEFFMEEEVYFEEEFIEEEIVMEEPMEEFYEETNEIVETFLPVVSEEETFSSEETFVETEGPIFMEPTEDEVVEEEYAATETFEEEVIEEEPTEMAEEKTVAKTPTKMVQNTHEEKKEKAIEEKEEVKEEKEEKIKEESVAEKKETEEVAEEESDSESSTKIASANNSEQKKIQQKKALVKNIDRVMDKVDSDIKDIAKNLQIKNIIKIQAMTSEQASLDIYSKALFYEPKDIYLEQLNIFDNRQIYANVNLASYIKTDKVAIKANALHKINIKKQRLLKELELLKNGKI
jgi:outer membrane biosynthesis protein TonB